jgi:hypothetical protein
LRTPADASFVARRNRTWSSGTTFAHFSSHFQIGATA